MTCNLCQHVAHVRCMSWLLLTAAAILCVRCRTGLCDEYHTPHSVSCVTQPCLCTQCARMTALDMEHAIREPRNVVVTCFGWKISSNLTLDPAEVTVVSGKNGVFWSRLLAENNNYVCIWRLCRL